MDKNYDLVFETPKGIVYGYLVFMIEKQALNGVVKMGDVHASFFGGSFDEACFSFEGSFYYHYHHLNFQVQGHWLDNQIQGRLTIRKLELTFKGYEKTSAV